MEQPETRLRRILLASLGTPRESKHYKATYARIDRDLGKLSDEELDYMLGEQRRVIELIQRTVSQKKQRR